MSERVSFKVYAGRSVRFAQETADRFVGQVTRLGGSSLRIVSAELDDDGQSIRLTAEKTTDEPMPAELMEGGIRYLREKYAIGFITFAELEEGLDSVLSGGPVNVPRAGGRSGG